MTHVAYPGCYCADCAQRCADRQGKIITLRKPCITHVCVGPDGRWLEYY